MYQIILVAALFTNAKIPTGNIFITPEACTVTANAMSAKTGNLYKCEPVSFQKDNKQKI